MIVYRYPGTYDSREWQLALQLKYSWSTLNETQLQIEHPIDIINLGAEILGQKASVAND